MNELRDVEAQFVPLDSLKAYDGNAKKHDSDNIDAIANSISEFGFRNPILAWHNEDGVPEIVAGHGRAAAAKKLRMEQVPVIFVDDLTDAQRRMLTLADNQTTLMTGWDDQTLQEELDALSDLFDVDDLGFDFKEIACDEVEPDMDIDIPESNSLIVQCDDEEECQALFEELKGRGFNCRVSTLWERPDTIRTQATLRKWRRKADALLECRPFAL